MKMGYDVRILNPFQELLPFLSKNKVGRSRLTTIVPELWQAVSRIPGVKSYPIERLSYGFLSSMLTKVLYSQVKRENVNLLQAETFLAADIALPVKNSIKLPMIFDSHSGLFTDELRRIINPTPSFLHYWAEREKQILSSSEHVIVTTIAMKQQLETSLGLTSISYAPNGATPMVGSRSSHRFPLKVVYAGIFAYWERIHDYFDAIKLARNDDFEFYLIGDGYQKKELLERISKERIPVNYLGYLPRDEFKKQMSTMHVGIAPWERERESRYYSSTKAFEYLSMGLPVVCADAGEWASIVSDNSCGILVPPEDPEAIANAILAYRNRKMWETHSANGLNLIREKFSWEKVISNLRPVYEDMRIKMDK